MLFCWSAWNKRFSSNDYRIYFSKLSNTCTLLSPDTKSNAVNIPVNLRVLRFIEERKFGFEAPAWKRPSALGTLPNGAAWYASGTLVCFPCQLTACSRTPKFGTPVFCAEFFWRKASWEARGVRALNLNFAPSTRENILRLAALHSRPTEISGIRVKVRRTGICIGTLPHEAGHRALKSGHSLSSRNMFTWKSYDHILLFVELKKLRFVQIQMVKWGLLSDNRATAVFHQLWLGCFFVICAKRCWHSFFDSHLNSTQSTGISTIIFVWSWKLCFVWMWAVFAMRFYPWTRSTVVPAYNDLA